MIGLDVGDRVRVDIPVQDDQDFDDYHGCTGEVIDTIEDDAGRQTGDTRDSQLFQVKFSNGRVADFRWRDLRPAHTV